ncbi:MAG: hypothetical protein KGY61_07785 [Desulfobacterales bacterium]|nr:hypothetical protein [Desulfobacterales bacterium]
MNIKLDLSRHCVETEMKRQYNKTISAYFKKKPDEDKQALEAQIDLLQQGLETFDFNRLRGEYPELRGEEVAEVELSATEDDKPQILINGKAIDAY